MDSTSYDQYIIILVIYPLQEMEKVLPSVVEKDKQGYYSLRYWVSSMTISLAANVVSSWN